MLELLAILLVIFVVWLIILAFIALSLFTYETIDVWRETRRKK